MTPRQFHFLLERYERKLEHYEMLAGLVCSTVANWSMAAPKEALKHTDFMPSQWLKNAKKPRKKKLMDSDEVREVFKSMFRGMIANNA